MNDPNPDSTIATRGWPPPQWPLPRWRWAGGAFLLGVVYTGVSLLIGAEVRFAGRDVTLIAGGIVELSFALFGYLIGLTREARARERAAAALEREHLEMLADAHRRLAQAEKLASLGELASAIAHEVRNPLAILRARLQNLDEELPRDAAAAHRAVEELLEEIDRLAHVTRSLVDFARPPVLTRRRVSSTDLLERVRTLAEPMLRATPGQLEVRAPPSAPDLDIDSDLLCQALLGLLENAAAASPGGRIRLDLCTDGDTAEGDTAEGDTVTFAISDQGPGVPRALRGRIFEPFFTTRPDGAGLGLAVVQQIVRAHGGEVTVTDAVDVDESDRTEHDPRETGRGACFRVVLPVEHNHERAA